MTAQDRGSARLTKLLADPQRAARVAAIRDQMDQGASDSLEELDDWPIDAADLRKSLLEAEADLTAGRTFSAEEVRARYGLPGAGADCPAEDPR